MYRHVHTCALTKAQVMRNITMSKRQDTAAAVRHSSSSMTQSTYNWQGSESFLQPPVRHDFPWQGSESFLQPPARHNFPWQGSESFLQLPARHDISRQGSESFLQPPAGGHNFPWQGSESFLQLPASGHNCNDGCNGVHYSVQR